MELTEYEMILDALAGYAEDGEEPPAKLVQLKEAFEAGTRREIREDRSLIVERGTGHRPVPGQRCGNGYVRQASEKQVRFVNHLLATRVLPAGNYGPQNALARFREGSCNLRHVSDLIDWLIRLPERADAVQADLATEKQVACILREVARRQGGKACVDTALSVEGVDHPSKLSRKVASSVLDTLFNSPFTPRPVAAPAEALSIGIYRKANGRLFKVYPNQTKSHLLAKELVIEDGEPRWDYAGSAPRFVVASEKLSLEEAKEFGKITGICCACGRTLTDEISIENGIGPVCAKSF